MLGIGIEADRVQWGVGNGGFHTEDIRRITKGVPTETPLLRIVYDCGSMRAGSVLQREIDAWADATGGYPFVEGETSVLVISHFDRDHVNGLPRLKAVGFTPDYVILPFLSSFERVLQLVQNIASKPRSFADEQDRADDEFVDRLSSDPVATVEGLWPKAEVILFEEPSDGPDDPESSPDTSAPAAGQGGEERIEVSVEGRLGIRVTLTTAGGRPRRTALWEYRWREHRAVSAVPGLPAALKSGLATVLGLTAQQVESPQAVWHAIAAKDKWKDVAALYRKLIGKKDLNPYSLVLWSGTGQSGLRVNASRGVTLRGITPQQDGALPPWLRSGGWLGTGDADLRSPADVDLLFRRLSSRIDEVDVLNAPHHGSRHNSAVELYRRVPTRSGTVLTSADGKNGFGHPHGEMVKDALLAGRTVVRVGDSAEQRFMWSVTVRA